MQLIVVADDAGKEEFKTKKIHGDIELIFIEQSPQIGEYNFADAFFILKEVTIEDVVIFEDKPVFINSTIDTLKELALPQNFSRINAWPTFISRNIWEIATANEAAVKNIFEKLNWEYSIVVDEPGLVAARIISMIINEAYFALGEDVSSKNEIDIAMKLGTNYPYGPFEWSKKIGLQRVYDLLEKLSTTGSRYTVAPAMKKEIENL